MTQLIVVVLALLMAQHPGMSPGMSHEEHMKQMQMRGNGNVAMGFDQSKVKHHFELTRDGGMIQVAANDSTDALTVKQIRSHLQTIAHEFSEGVFTAPIATHGEIPPGVPVMRARKARIHYTYEETADGGRVIVGAKDRKARTAIHQFLQYQIREHGN